MSKQKQIEFLSLYEEVHLKFEKFCRARVYGEMDYKDLMNETLLVAFEKFDAIENKASFLSFLFGTSIRILANNNRKKRESLVANELAYNAVIDSNQDTEKNANIYMLYKALSLLPNDQKECLILFEINGFSIKEITKIQNTSESSVKQRLRRGRIKLKEILTFESEHKIGEVAK